MKILIGMPDKNSWGGPAACEPPFVATLRNSGADVAEETYVYGDKEKPTPLFERVRRVVKTALRFRRLVRENDFDIVHLNTAFDLRTLLRDCASLRLMKPGKTKVFLKIHGSEKKYLDSRQPLVKWLRADLNKRADGFGVFTEEEKNEFIRAGFDAEKLFLVKNAVTLADDLPASFCRALKSPTDVFKLLFVSRFTPAKGLLETIRACRILKDKNYKFELTAIGDGEIRRAAEAETAQLDLQNEIKFTGYIPESEVAEYFLDADIFVFPSAREGFPIVLFKAVAAGLPIVVTEIYAAKDYLREPENCLFTTQNPEIIAAKIGAIIESSELRARMSENNLRFGEQLAPTAIACEFLEIYRKIIKLDEQSKFNE